MVRQVFPMASLGACDAHGPTHRTQGFKGEVVVI